MKATRVHTFMRKEIPSVAHKIPKHKPKIGIVLGSGSARGWAHIGVLKCLEQHNIIPEVICGTSIGALVGGAYAAGQIKALESFATSITWKNYLEFIDFKMSLSGIFSGERIVTLMQQEAKETIMIENLPKPFACVATDLRTGKEIWLKKGSLFHAIRASAAIPLIFDPVKDEERSTKHRTEWLVDGAVVNPLPISLCRALGAEVVIAVNLNRDILVRNFAKMKSGSLEKAFLSSLNPIPQSVHDTASSLVEYLSKAKYYFSSPKGSSAPIETVTSEPITEEESNVHPPNLVKVITTAINIMQQRIMTSRIAGDPPEIELNPKLTEMDTFDFHKGQYAIQCGEECVKQMLPMIQETIKRFH